MTGNEKKASKLLTKFNKTVGKITSTTSRKTIIDIYSNLTKAIKLLKEKK